MPTHDDDKPDLHGGAVHIPRSRGALSGLLLIILGAWAAIIPFIGPLFTYAYTPDKSWTWTAARGWLEVLPGAVALVAGVILLMSANRVTASVAAWLGIAAGVWLVIGRDLAQWLHIGSPGQPASKHQFLAALESLGMFSGIGAAILLFAATALGRLSIRSVRDVRAAQRHERKVEKQRQKTTDSAYAAGRRDEAAARRYDSEHAGNASEDRAAEQRADGEHERSGLLHRVTHRDHGADNSSNGATATQHSDRTS
jgi:hypothetical protein